MPASSNSYCFLWRVHGRNQWLSLTKKFGGDTFNTALYLSRLTQHRASLCSLRDRSWKQRWRLSQNMIDSWQLEGYSNQFRWTHCEQATWTLRRSKPMAGERHFHYWRNDAAVVKSSFMLMTWRPARIARRQSMRLHPAVSSIAILDDDSRDVCFVAAGVFSN